MQMIYLRFPRGVGENYPLQNGNTQGKSENIYELNFTKKFKKFLWFNFISNKDSDATSNNFTRVYP